MAEQGLDREAVQNPFDMGPNTNFQQPARQMKQQINKPRDAFQSSQNGMMIVDVLQNFASTGGKMYEIHANKKIAEDKVVQTALLITTLLLLMTPVVLPVYERTLLL